MPFSCTRSQSKDDLHRHSLLKKHVENCSKNDIQLNNLHLTDEDIPFVIKKLLKKTKYQTLSLASNQLTSQSIEIIVSSLKSNEKLTHLILSENPLGDSSIEFLCDLIKSSKNLYHISLSDTQLTDVAMKLLVDTLIQNSRSIRCIDLRSNRLITDSSIDLFIQLVENNQTLSACRLDNCGLSEQGKEQLKQIKSIKW